MFYSNKKAVKNTKAEWVPNIETKTIQCHILWVQIDAVWDSKGATYHTDNTSTNVQLHHCILRGFIIAWKLKGIFARHIYKHLRNIMLEVMTEVMRPKS